MLNKVEIDDIVIFKPSADEVYMWEIPEFGTTGSVRALTYNIGLNQTLGIYLPMCIVDFGLEHYVPIYLEDLKMVKKHEIHQ